MFPSSSPPGGRSPHEVPMFVALGWDDNGYSGFPGSGGTGGLAWALALCEGLRNPPGAFTHAGEPVRMSFYLTSGFARDDRREPPAFVREAWRALLHAGHELGNHCLSHDDGSAFDVAAWSREIGSCASDLRELGLTRAGERLGFRAPYLAYNDAALAAVHAHGFAYDCSIEEGFQEQQDGTNFVWPYRLDRGSPGHAWHVEKGLKAPISPREGLWEMPAYAVIAPPDEACEAYGVAPGFRRRLAARQPYFHETDGKITGFDYNLWVEFGMTREEFGATLRYTLDLRLRGNRAPLLFGGHTDYYSSKYQGIPNATLEERQAAFSDFLAYALLKPEVRVVTVRDVLAWIESAMLH